MSKTNGLISQLERIGDVKNEKTGLGSSSLQNLNQSTLIEKSKIFLTLPILTVSEANGLLSKTRFYKNGKAKPEHWTEKSARHRMQKNAVYLALNPQKDYVQLPCIVKLIRSAPRELDEEDNLRIALKWIKDAVAEIIMQDFVPGRADGDKRIKWEYAQEKSKEYGVKIEIW